MGGMLNRETGQASAARLYRITKGTWHLVISHNCANLNTWKLMNMHNRGQGPELGTWKLRPGPAWVAILVDV